MEPSDRQRDAAQATVGVLYGLAAYCTWGIAPLYFKQAKHLPLEEVLAHRVIWSAVLLAGLVAFQRRRNEVLQALRQPRTLLTIMATTALIATNWCTFIWSVNNNRVKEASLGYFIVPLLNVLLGRVLLGERLRPWQAVSVAIAATGVGCLTFSQHSKPPWIAFILAATFGLYGLLRKTTRVEALAGLTAEMGLLLPVALTYAVVLGVRGRSSFIAGTSIADPLILMGTGIMTAVPLLCFTHAARRLRLTTLGFLQYLAPTGHLLLAVALYDEQFHRADAFCFGCIWVALSVYSVEAVRHQKQQAVGM